MTLNLRLTVMSVILCRFLYNRNCFRLINLSYKNPPPTFWTLTSASWSPLISRVAEILYYSWDAHPNFRCQEETMGDSLPAHFKTLLHARIISANRLTATFPFSHSHSFIPPYRPCGLGWRPIYLIWRLF